MDNKFLNFLDMIDGGGAGASGDTFKGGGLLSMLGNAMFKPRGYWDRMKAREETRPQMRPGDPASYSTRSAPEPEIMYGPQNGRPRRGPNLTPPPTPNPHPPAYSPPTPNPHPPLMGVGAPTEPPAPDLPGQPRNTRIPHAASSPGDLSYQDLMEHLDLQE